MAMLIVFLALLLTFAMTVGVVVVLSIWFDNIVEAQLRVSSAYSNGTGSISSDGLCELHRLGIYSRLDNQKHSICNRA